MALEDNNQIHSMAIQTITSKKLKHPISRCISSFEAINPKDIQNSNTLGISIQGIYALCVDGLNGIDNRITTIHESGDDFADNLHQLALNASDKFCKLVLWLGKYLFDEDRNIAYNAQLMLEIITDEKVISSLREQWYSYFDFEENRYQRFLANYPLSAEGINSFINEDKAYHVFNDWFPLDTFLPESIKKEIQEAKTNTINPEDLANDLPF